MKKICLFLAALLGLTIIASCGDKEQGDTREDAVRNYGKWFIEKLAANEIDSIKVSYPEIEYAKELQPVQSDTIIIYEYLPDQFDMTLTPGVKLKVDRAKDGKITVIESRGLFAFPHDKVELAKQTGMWDEGLNDIQLAERMRDDEFFKYIQNLLVDDSSKIITVGAFVSSGDAEGEGWYPIHNHSKMKVEGREYSILMDEWHYDQEAEQEVHTTVTRPGKDIEPYGSAQVKVGGGGTEGNKIKGIEWNITPEEIKAKFGTFTGKEYQEYITTM